MIDITPYLRTTRIAYFTMEIGIRAEMHTYSGGLGILAGDAARTAADLGLPMVFVTLASRSGICARKSMRKERKSITRTRGTRRITPRATHPYGFQPSQSQIASPMMSFLSAAGIQSIS